MIEEMLLKLSPTCRQETEAAITAQVELSEYCREEIQRVVAGMQGGMPSRPQVDYDENNDDPFATPAPRKPKKQRDPNEKPWIHPGIVIAGFFIALFGGVGAYVTMTYKESPSSKAKKLSKKKVIMSPF